MYSWKGSAGHVATHRKNQQTTAYQDGYIAIAANAFLVDRKASGKAMGTIRNCREHLKHFMAWCDALAIRQIHELTADTLRRFLLSLAETHNPGSVHGFFRALRNFLRWVESEEVMPAEWRNPIHKEKAPRVPERLREAVPLDHVNALIKVSSERDKAIFLVLLDTTMRAMELCRCNPADVDLAACAIAIPKSKRGKPRTVFIERKTPLAVRAYLRTRRDHCPTSFVTSFEDRLSYNGLREILCREARLVAGR